MTHRRKYNIQPADMTVLLSNVIKVPNIASEFNILINNALAVLKKKY